MKQHQKLNILILYDRNSTYTNTVLEYLDSFKLYSSHNIFFAIGTQFSRCELDLSLFDVVLIHYSVRICYGLHAFGGLSPHYYEALKKFLGYKILIIQDEYNNTNIAKKMMQELGINLVYTCVPQEYVQKIYPQSEFPNTEFLSILTGYISDPFQLNEFVKPIREREYEIVYRGRKLPFLYGNLGQEKYVIGKKMKEICEKKRIKTDIECDESQRIYGDSWYQFLANSRATLGTESGSNIFDFTGEIDEQVKKALVNKPGMSYEEAHDLLLKQHEDFIKMNQISPKIFESILLRTALILFEGDYSGVIHPNRHYIPLKKDWSNVEDVLRKLEDITYLEEMTSRAYQEVVESGKYSYERFIQQIDETLATRVKIARGIKLVSMLVMHEEKNSKRYVNAIQESGKNKMDKNAMVTNMPLSHISHSVVREKGMIVFFRPLYSKLTRTKWVRAFVGKIAPSFLQRAFLRLRERILYTK